MHCSEILAIAGVTLPESCTLETQRVITNLIRKCEIVVKRERVDDAPLAVHQINTVAIINAGADVETQRPLLANSSIENVVGPKVIIAVHVVGLPSTNTRVGIVLTGHCQCVLNDVIVEIIFVLGLSAVLFAKRMTERELMTDGIVQVVIAQMNVQRVGIVTHVNKVHQVGGLCLSDVLQMQLLCVPCLGVNGRVLNKAVPDVDRYGAANDSGVNHATLIVQPLAAEGEGKAQLSPNLLTFVLIPVVD